MKFYEKMMNLRFLLQGKWRFLSAFVLGALAVLSFAPFDFYLAAIFSVSGLFYLLENNKEKVFWLGFCYGFGYFLCGVYWIAISLLVDAQRFAWMIPFALSLIPGALAMYFAAFSWLYCRFCRFFVQFYQKILFFAFLWLIFELLRGVLFTGFPWNLFGYNLMFSDYSSQLASIVGVYGLSFISVIFCLSLVSFWWDRKVFWVILTIFVLNLSFGYGRLQLIEQKKTGEKIRLVQGNVKQEMKWNPRQKYHNLLRHIHISQMKGFDEVKAVIWSETAVPYAIGLDENLTKNLALAVPKDGFLATGGLRLDYEAKKAYNSVFLFDGAKFKHYDKHHLVPFGEYVPLARFLPFVKKIAGGGDGFGEGEGAQTLEIASLKLSPLVCYEVIFSSQIIDRKNRPDLLINVTNDAWFGNSLGPFQHLNMARMRAIEYGISLARVANTGVSAYIDVFGRVVAEIGLDERGFVDVELLAAINESFYSQFKKIMLLLVLGGVFGVAIFVKKHQKK